MKLALVSIPQEEWPDLGGRGGKVEVVLNPMPQGRVSTEHFWQKFWQKFLKILRILAEILRKKLACGASGCIICHGVA